MKELKKIGYGAQDLVQNAIQVSELLCQRGWAEKNAGNVSIDLTKKINMTYVQKQKKNRFIPDDRVPDGLDGHVIYITGTGARFRDLKNGPEKHSCIVVLDAKRKGYHLIWGGKDQPDFRPSSELPAHLGLHLQLTERDDSRCVVLHTHPTHLIALSHSPDCAKEDLFNNVIWSMMPEIKVFVPKGIGYVPYLLPGSQKLALATMEALNKHDVILWEKHGCLAIGKDVQEAYDLIDISNKGAELYLICKQAGFQPKGISREELAELMQAFGIE